MNIRNVIRLSELLGEMGNVKRATRLPSGEAESDSHHSFSLALIAYDICVRQCPELDMAKVMLFALTHDLLEIVTGDEDTLHYTAEQMRLKQEKEHAAVDEFGRVFAGYPMLREAVEEYERLDTPEAVSVFILDKACTTWTHFPDNAEHARNERGLETRQDIEEWGERMRTKIKSRVKVEPPQAIMDVYEASFSELAALYD